MKDWQNGYPLELLKSHESLYEKYNTFSAGPFLQVKKNNIAEWLKDDSFRVLPGASYRLEKVKTRTPIYSFGNVLIANKEVGDITISGMVGDYTKMLWALKNLDTRENYWLYGWAEDPEFIKLATEAGFRYIHGKISTFGDVTSIWFKDGVGGFADSERPFKKVDAAESVCVKNIGFADIGLINAINRQLVAIDYKFQNHYSNYNNKKSWSAFSLRGYSPDPAFIEKPIEMNEKWQEKNRGKAFELQNTPLWDKFNSVQQLLLRWELNTIHRVRFMKLIPGGGELSRHTDQVDPDSGNGPGKLTRIHFPIVTNPDVKFSVWGYTGVRNDVNMRVGECWMLNTNYPHQVINSGKDDRIHLVVDIISSPEIRKSITM